MKTTLTKRQIDGAWLPEPDVQLQGVREMLRYEVLARARMREAEEQARHHRLVRRLVAVRRWERLARYARSRVERAQLGR